MTNLDRVLSRLFACLLQPDCPVAQVAAITADPSNFTVKAPHIMQITTASLPIDKIGTLTKIKMVDHEGKPLAGVPTVDSPLDAQIASAVVSDAGDGTSTLVVTPVDTGTQPAAGAQATVSMSNGTGRLTVIIPLDVATAADITADPANFTVSDPVPATPPAPAPAPGP